MKESACVGRPMRSGLVRIALSVSLLALAMQVEAQTYPTRPIRMLLPYAPGGGTDLIARPLAQKLSEALGQQVIVDNRGGANGTIGMELAARAPADGHTIVLALTAQLAINPAFYATLSYDPVRDYVPISLLGTAPYLMTVHPALPAKSLKELIALAKAKPKQLAFASSGTGGIPHFAGELLMSMTGIEMIHVPYKGGGPALIDLMGGHVQLNFAVIPVAAPHVRAGKLRAVAVTSARRFRTLPEVPTMAETLPGYEMTTWYGVLAPARTSKAIVARLHGEIVKVLGMPDLIASLLASGFESHGSTPGALDTHMKSEIAKWTKIVKASGITAESVR